MARILYSMSGEGRGHATRVRAVVEMLRRDHDVTLLAPCAAREMLSAAYAGTAVRVERIPGLGFGYGGRGQVSVPATAAVAAAYLAGLPRLVRRLERMIVELQIDVAISDFEPALPRAARRRRVPFISLDHQHFLLTSDFRALPAGLRRHAALMGLVVRAYHRGAALTVVSSFYSPPLRPGLANVVQVGVLLRPEVLAARIEPGSHLVAYLRRAAPDTLLDVLASSGREVRVYGLGERPARGSLRFRAISEAGFIDDLARAEALLTTAGNQLVGEALHLGKPVFAMPETGNHEQAINAHYLVGSGWGAAAPLERTSATQLREFLGRLDAYRERIASSRFDGGPATLAALRRHLVERAPAERALRGAHVPLQQLPSPS